MLFFHARVSLDLEGFYVALDSLLQGLARTRTLLMVIMVMLQHCGLALTGVYIFLSISLNSFYLLINSVISLTYNVQFSLDTLVCFRNKCKIF